MTQSKPLASKYLPPPPTGFVWWDAYLYSDDPQWKLIEDTEYRGNARVVACMRDDWPLMKLLAIANGYEPQTTENPTDFDRRCSELLERLEAFTDDVRALAKRSRNPK